MPKGTQLAVMSPGTHEKDYLSGALDVATGTLAMAVGRVKPTRWSGNRCSPWITPIPLPSARGAMSWRTMTRSIKRRPSNSGWRITTA